MDHIYFIKGNELNQERVVFNKETMAFYIVNPMVEDICAHIGQHGFDSARRKYTLEDKDIDALREMTLNRLENTRDMTKLEDNQPKKILERLVLGVTNVCNMKCSYCYAEGGCYQSEESLMSIEVALRTLDQFYSYFDEISVIQFFGGEPLLNVPIIEKVCVHLTDLFNRGEISALPKFGIVTNGTLIDLAVVEIIKKFNIHVTVSVDGDQIVHDINRIDNQGQGTYRRIIENLEPLYARTQQPETFEVTYNQMHVEMGKSIEDVCQHLLGQFPKTFLHVAPVSTPSPNLALKDRTAFVESVDQVFASHQSMQPFTYSLVQRLIEALKDNKRSRYICNAGLGTISVDAKGFVYPCFMFTDLHHLCMGHVDQKNLFGSEAMKVVRQAFYSMDKANDIKCKSCMLEHFCNGCHGMNYFANLELGNYESEFCTMNTQMAQRAIVNLAQVYARGIKEGIS